MVQKRRGIGWLAVFLTVMALLTFFSRSIRYYFLPKVEVNRVSGGVLRTVFSGNEFVLSADNKIRVDIPVALDSYALRVERLMVVRLSKVKKDDALLRFDPVQGAEALWRAEQALFGAEEALLGWKLEFQNALNSLDIKIMALQFEKDRAPDEAELIDLRLQFVQDEKAALEESAIFDGTARAALERQVERAKMLYGSLRELSGRDWYMNASENGFVSEIYVNENDVYPGLFPMMSIIPENEEIQLGLLCGSEIAISSDEDVRVFDDLERVWIYAGETGQGEWRVLWAKPWEDFPEPLSLEQLRFVVQSPYYPALIPNELIVGGSVYVLSTREGFFGSDELYAKELRPEQAQSDGKFTGISAGLSPEDQIITAWDRPIEDGSRVTLRLE